MQNKKGILTKNVLSLIIAAIGVVLLIFVSVALYNNFENQERKNAQSFLNSIDEKIKNLKDGETGKFTLNGIEGWYFVGWSKNELNRPEKCFLDSCLCVCPEVENPEDFGESCQNKGFCRKINYDNLDMGSSIGLIPGNYNYMDLNNDFRNFQNKRTQSLIDIHEPKLKEITIHKNLEKVPLQEKLEYFEMNETLLSEMIIVKLTEDYGSGFERVLVFEALANIVPSDFGKYVWHSFSPHSSTEVAEFEGMGLPGLLTIENNCLFLEIIKDGWEIVSSSERLSEKIFMSTSGPYKNIYYGDSQGNKNSLYGGKTNYYEQFFYRFNPFHFERNGYNGNYKNLGRKIYNIDSYHGPCKAQGD